MIAFDFDGVLIDTAVESSLTAYNAATGELCVAPTQTLPHYSALFVRHFHLTQGAGNTIPLARWCLSHDASSVLSGPELALLAEQESSDLAVRTAEFFASRKRFQEHHFEQWLSLQRPFEPLWGYLREKNRSITIVTNKNRPAVHDLCKHFDLSIDDASLYTGEGGHKKLTNVARLCDLYGNKPIHFIEDSLLNLKELMQHFPGRIRPYLATWGYLGPNDIAEAATLGIPCVTQEELIRLVETDANSTQSPT